MAKPYSVSVLKGVGHPWHTDDPYWDMMIIKAINDDVLMACEEKALERGWKILSTGFADRGTGPISEIATAIFYKPQRSGPANAEWVDRAWPDPEDW